MNVKTASRVARSMAARSRSLGDLADGYIGRYRRSYWTGPADGVELDENLAKELNSMAERQDRIVNAIEKATVNLDLSKL